MMNTLMKKHTIAIIIASVLFGYHFYTLTTIRNNTHTIICEVQNLQGYEINCNR